MYLGVDGGGTKTAFALIDACGNVLAEHEETTCYHLEVGIDGARNILDKGLTNTLEKAEKSLSDLTYSFFGLPAYGEDSKLNETMANLPAHILPKEKFLCGNDMVNGWAAAFGAKDGINIVAGTGSIAYGVNGLHSARCGGWGELFSDEGSAYWVGTKGLNTFTRMSDGRTPKGPLYNLFKNSLGIQQDLDITALVLSKWQGERSRIAGLSSLVSEAAELGDKHALGILNEAGQELAEIVDSTRIALGFPDKKEVPVSFSGGVFCAEDLILKPFVDALNKRYSNYLVTPPSFTPVIGAALYAYKLSGNDITPEALSRLKR